MPAYADMKLFFSSPLIVAKSLCLCLAVLFLWQLVSGFMMYSSFNNTMKQAPSSITIKQDDVLRGNKLRVNAPFFGDYVPKGLSDAAIRRSMLDLTVVGIIYAKPEANSQIIMKASNGHEQAYKLGDHLPGGAIIKRITEDGVLIMRNGAFESLSLPKNELFFEPVSKALQ